LFNFGFFAIKQEWSNADKEAGGNMIRDPVSLRARALELALHFVDNKDISISLDENGRIVLSPKLFDAVKTVVKFITDGRISEQRGNSIDIAVIEGNIRVIRGKE
jgi:hypothetical protein